MVIQYTDLAQKDFSMGWTLTNENPGIYRDWTVQTQPKRVLAVLSGGEVPLLSFLPYGCRVTGVDLSYNSIRASMVKIALLKKYGTELKAKLPQREDEFIKFVDANLIEDMPSELRKNAGYRITQGQDWTYAGFKHLWRGTPDDILEKARQNIGNIEVVHGNLEAITDDNYDLLYVSNVFDNGIFISSLSEKMLQRRSLKHVMSSGVNRMCEGSVPQTNLKLLERINDTPQLPLKSWGYYLHSVPTKDKIN